MFGVVPNRELQTSNAPFSTAVNAMFGGTWAGYVMAGAVVISGFGALNGWTMICAEMPLAAAKDGLFPERFGRLSSKGVPAFGIVASTVLASVFTVFSYLGSRRATRCSTPWCSCPGSPRRSRTASPRWPRSSGGSQDGRELHTPRVVRDVTVAVVALVFSVLFIWYSRNTGEEARGRCGCRSSSAASPSCIGIPVYLAQRAQHDRPAPPVPAYAA